VEISEEMVTRALDVLCEVAAVPRDWVRRALTAALGDQSSLPFRPSLPPGLSSAPVPVFEGGQQTGFLVLTKVTGGYEARCFKAPATVRPGSMGTIPLTALEPLWAALYDDDRNFVRALDA
jgi:hypothetical protein